MKTMYNLVRNKGFSTGLCFLVQCCWPFIHNKDHSVEYGAAKMAFGCCQWPNDLDQCPLTAPLCHKSTRQISTFAQFTM